MVRRRPQLPRRISYRDGIAGSTYAKDYNLPAGPDFSASLGPVAQHAWSVRKFAA